MNLQTKMSFFRLVLKIVNFLNRTILDGPESLQIKRHWQVFETHCPFALSQRNDIINRPTNQLSSMNPELQFLINCCKTTPSEEDIKPHPLTNCPLITAHCKLPWLRLQHQLKSHFHHVYFHLVVQS